MSEVSKLIEALRDAATTIRVALDMTTFEERPATKAMMVATLKSLDAIIDQYDDGA